MVAFSTGLAGKQQAKHFLEVRFCAQCTASLARMRPSHWTPCAYEGFYRYNGYISIAKLAAACGQIDCQCVFWLFCCSHLTCTHHASQGCRHARGPTLLCSPHCNAFMDDGGALWQQIVRAFDQGAEHCVRFSPQHHRVPSLPPRHGLNHVGT